MERYLGVMSGTSMDGIDVALVCIEEGLTQLEGYATFPLPDSLVPLLHQLCTPGDNEINLMGNASRQLAYVYADACQQLLDQHGLTADDIRAIGCHGQTVRHHPEGAAPFTLQLGDPNTLAVLSGIDVIADFRRKDMALGGQGAPLVPALHQALFARQGEQRVVVNLGGIANLTWLPGDETLPVIGFDSGPANTLLDAWCRRCLGQPMDRDGQWAATGVVEEHLLGQMLTEPYLTAPYPKSTGRELFNPSWLDAHLHRYKRAVSDVNVQATLAQFTVETLCRAVEAVGTPRHMILCGGGVHNKDLLRRFALRIAPCKVSTSAQWGIEPDAIEAIAFAWLAWAFVHRKSGNIPSVTGAKRPAVLGGYYPAE
ncbi:anhydro-N-acetylmuramic acid kinase [Aestuariibacter halophilus]|uniref:Anhydro-N-acetylmuramic acid kinase n=1 Tax=Fluctibacter halophilus TaxID=226011 RepID=A0ABS8GC98_9ALTE|nr:anhydro-N-acetylmuramic acid kinase [Aestuariibacter halophilus]MCC2617445.1 anhydro-N-acetylmuramic acid kinase [Aestuariibacter halophilus]